MSARRIDGRFQNAIATASPGPRHVLRYLRERDAGPWRRIDAPPGPRPAERVDDLRVTFVGHATVLIQQDGLNVLTDPVWSERASPVSFAGPRRMRPPGIRFEDLPPIDVVLLSHDHYDHLDQSTMARLASSHRPRVLTGLGVARHLRHLELAVEELDWWQSVDLGGGRRAAFTPAQHFSGRTPFDRNTTLWGGLALTGPAGTTFFAGDTAKGPHFAEVRARLGAPRVALLPIGAYLPSWFMSPVHVSPAEALDAHHELGAASSAAIHYGTFRLSDEGMDDPPRHLARALELDAQVRGARADFRVLPEGEPWDVPRAGGARDRERASESA